MGSIALIRFKGPSILIHRRLFLSVGCWIMLLGNYREKLVLQGLKGCPTV